MRNTLYKKYKKFYRKYIVNNSTAFYTLNVVISIIAWCYLRFVMLTSCITYDLQANKDELKQQTLIAGFWHGRLLAPLFVRKFYTKGYVLISYSKSAYLMKLICKYFFVNRIEGSNNRGSLDSTNKILQLLKNSHTTLAIAPDGSIGPRMQCSSGIANIALLSRTPIVLMTYSAKRAVIVNSWDRFFVPLPFNNITIHISSIIDYKDHKNELKSIEDLRQYIEHYLNNKTWELDKKYNQPHIDQAEFGRKGVTVKIKNRKDR